MSRRRALRDAMARVRSTAVSNTRCERAKQRELLRKLNAVSQEAMNDRLRVAGSCPLPTATPDVLTVRAHARHGAVCSLAVLLCIFIIQ